MFIYKIVLNYQIYRWKEQNRFSYKTCAVSNMRVRLLIFSDIGGTIIKWKQEKLGVVTWKC